MNKNFIQIRQNFLLLVVLTVTGTLSLFLIYLSLNRHADVTESNDKIEGFKNELQKAHARKPAPVRLNKINILRDAEELEKRNNEIQKCFGKYYRKSLIEFAARIGISEDTLLKNFQNFYRSLPNERQGDLLGGRRDQAILDEFFTYLVENKVKAPFQVFEAALKQRQAKELFDTQFNASFASYAKSVKEPNDVLAAGLLAFTKKLDGAVGRLQKAVKTGKIKSASAPDFMPLLRNFANEIGLTPQGIRGQYGDSFDDILTLKYDSVQKLQDLRLIRAYLAAGERAKILKSAGLFYESMKKQTVQQVTPENNYGFLLAALGLPRTERIVVFSETLKKYKQQILTGKVIPGVETMEQVDLLTFPDHSKQVDVPQILRQMVLREDFFRRLSKAKVQELRSLQLLSPMGGTPQQGTYLEFKFRISLIGNIGSIRSLFNDMQSAVEENRVFIIQDVVLRREETEPITKLTSEDQDKLTDEALKLARDYQMQFKAAEKDDKNKDDKKDERILASTYGKAQIGANQELAADITFSILLYIGDEVARVKNESR